MMNGQDSSGITIQGDCVKVLEGSNRDKTFYYNGYEWVSGQSKTSFNQKPLFNLYDVDQVTLDNSVNYPNSTFL